jgi:hypothetical protein
MKARSATLVVIEFGASWPRWLNPNADRGDLAVVAQHYAGPPTDLITQVAMRVTRLQARGWQLSSMVLVSNGRADAPTAAARSILARGALAAALEPVALTSRVALRVESCNGASAAQAEARALTG